MSEDRHACLAGKSCRSSSIEDGVKVPAKTESPDTLCEGCIKAVSHAVNDMTELWLALHLAIGDQTRRPGQKVSGSRAAPININTDVDSLKDQIVEWLTAAAARVAEELSCDDPHANNTTNLQQAKTVIACTRLLSPNIDKLLNLPADEVTVWKPLKETDYPGESVLATVWDGTKRYIPNTHEVSMTGIDLALKIADLRHQARKLLGITNPNDAPPLPCPYCKEIALKRKHLLYSSGPKVGQETDRVECGSCKKDWPYTHYEFLCLIWLEEDEMERDRLQRELDVANRERDLLSWLLAKREHQFALALECTDIPASVWANEVLTYTLDVPDSYVSDKDAANIAGVADSTIRRWAHEGHISKHIAADGSMTFHVGEVYEYGKQSRRRTSATA